MRSWTSCADTCEVEEQGFTEMSKSHLIALNGSNEHRMLTGARRFMSRGKIRNQSKRMKRQYNRRQRRTIVRREEW